MKLNFIKIGIVFIGLSYLSLIILALLFTIPNSITILLLIMGSCLMFYFGLSMLIIAYDKQTDELQILRFKLRIIFQFHSMQKEHLKNLHNFFIEELSKTESEKDSDEQAKSNTSTI